MVQGIRAIALHFPSLLVMDYLTRTLLFVCLPNRANQSELR